MTRLVTLQSAVFVWRGQASVSWPLAASLHRKLELVPPLLPGDLGVDAETRALLDRAKDHRYNKAPGWDNLPDLPLLALLQHNGAATPLVDVTTDPAVALYFASLPAYDGGEEADGALLAIDVRPTMLSPWPARAMPFGLGADNTWTDALDLLKAAKVNIGLYTPPVVTSRILAQRGRFIFGSLGTGLPHTTLPLWSQPGWSSDRLKKLFGRGDGRKTKPSIPPVVAILVRAKHKPTIRRVLRDTYGIDAETLFPDLAGFSVANGHSGPRLSQESDAATPPPAVQTPWSFNGADL